MKDLCFVICYLTPDIFTDSSIMVSVKNDKKNQIVSNIIIDIIIGEECVKIDA